MTNEELAGEVYELAEAVRRLVVTMQTSLVVSSNAELPREQRELIFQEMAPFLPEVLEHVEGIKARLETR